MKPNEIQETSNMKGEAGFLIVDNQGNVIGLLWGECTVGCGLLVTRKEYLDAGGMDVSAGLETDDRDVLQPLGAKTRSDDGELGQVRILRC